MPAVVSPEHLAKVQRLRQLLSAYFEAEDLIRIGAYQKGTDPLLDRAVVLLPKIRAFLRQSRTEQAPIGQNIAALLALES